MAAPETSIEEPRVKVDLTNQVFLVTGASRGIGREVAEILGENNAFLVLNATNEDLLNKVAHGIDPTGERVVTVAGDIGVRTIKEIIQEKVPGPGELMVIRGKERWGRIDGAVHIAGINRDWMFFRQSDADWDAVLKVKLDGGRNLFLPAFDQMYRQKRGMLLGVTSISGEGNGLQANYGAANMGLEGLISCLDAEAQLLKRPEILARAVRLGAVDAGMMAELQASKPEAVQFFIGKMELGRLITAREAANKIVAVATGIDPNPKSVIHVFDGGFRREQV